MLSSCVLDESEVPSAKHKAFHYITVPKSRVAAYARICKQVPRVKISKHHTYLPCVCLQMQGVQLKSGPYFIMSSLFTKIYNVLY